MPFQVVPLETPIKGLVLVEPRVFGDDRGYFMETYHRRELASLGVDADFVQDNQSRSRKGTLRGLHFQKTHPQAKLVRALRGRVFDVAVDLRAGSPTEGRWCGLVLDDQSKRQFYIPVGFAHGFLALTDGAELAYKCSDHYQQEDEGGLLWNDPEVAIDWPLAGIGQPLVSPRDSKLPGLCDMRFRFSRGAS